MTDELSTATERAFEELEAGAGTPTGEGRDPEQVSLVDLLTMALAHWRVLVLVPLLLAGAAYTLLSVLPPSYTATVRFAPEQASSGTSGFLSGMAAEFGLDLGRGSNTLGYYAAVLTSNSLLHRVLGTTVPNTARQAGEPGRWTMLEQMRVPGPTPADSVYQGISRLRGKARVDVDGAAGMLVLNVVTHDPHLSLTLAEGFVAALDTFNTRIRQSTARSRRAFLEARSAAAYDSLVAAQEALRGFLEANRRGESSPRLIMERRRLELDVALKGDVYRSLVTQYESARVDEVNDIPAVTIVDPPLLPTIPSGPKPELFAAVALVLGAFGALSWVVTREYVAHLRRTRQASYVRLRRTWAQVGNDVRGAARTLISPHRWPAAVRELRAGSRRERPPKHGRVD